MAADWEIPMSLDDRGRRLVLARLRVLRGVISPDSSSVAEVLGQFADQVEAGAPVVRLRMSRLDTWGVFHLSAALSALVPRSLRLPCLDCGGNGDVPVPAPVQDLQRDFDRRYQLDRVSDPDRAAWLDMPADAAARARIEAANQAELARRKAARDRAEEESRRYVELGQLAEGEPVYEEKPAAAPDYMPAGLRGR